MDIPEYVLDALETVRDNSQLNMLARMQVINELSDEDQKAASWLLQNEERYVEALGEMGLRRADRPGK